MSKIFTGTMPALMTPCKADRTPDFEALVKKGKEMIAAGMSAVVYCGSMGDWPLLTDAQRMEGVEKLVEAGVPVVVGTGAINSNSATAHAAHAQKVGAAGLMVIPRVLSRGSSALAQKNHFKSILSAAPDVPAVIYNSPVYGFATRADLFFALRAEHSNLVGFKEFGGKDDLRYFFVHPPCFFRAPLLTILDCADRPGRGWQPTAAGMPRGAASSRFKSFRNYNNKRSPTCPFLNSWTGGCTCWSWCCLSAPN